MILNTDETYKELKTDRVMALFFRALKGESLSAQKLSYEYNVSSRSITRDLNSLKMFLADHRDTLGNAELIYSSSDHCYTLKMDNFLSNKELLAITKVLIGSRAFQNEELLELIRKLRQNTSTSDRRKLEQLIHKELFHYSEIGCDCQSVIDQLWNLTECIERKNVISITYHKMDRSQVRRKIKPVCILFSEYYFYLIAYKCDEEDSNVPFYFRVDRIVDMTIHREFYTLTPDQNVDEGELRRKSQFMWPGPSRRIRFEFGGPSVQAILDRIPTARVIDHMNGHSVIEADVYGDGIKMFLLSQGSWVKVLAPSEFVEEMKEEILHMQNLYT